MQVEADICFIGAGIASLYAAYNYIKVHPNDEVIILEKEDRIGGRAHNATFHGIEVPEGAGVGRVRKDKLLKHLIEELSCALPHTFQSPHDGSLLKSDINVMEIIAQLKRAAPRYDRRAIRFREFAEKELGTEQYEEFVTVCGYSDFENADIMDTLYHYGFEDTTSSPYWFRVDWNELVRSLFQELWAVRFITQTTVTSVQTGTVIHSKGIVRAKKIVVGTTLPTLQKLFPSHEVYHGICAQPFVRVYAKIKNSPAFSSRIRTYTLVDGPLQKIIPFRNNVYMIAYADNDNAMVLKNVGPRAFEKHVLKATGIRVQIEDIHKKYWPVGTHFFHPLPHGYKTRRSFVDAAQHPLPGVYVIGEVVSLRNQGWTEGALESVERIYADLAIPAKIPKGRPALTCVYRSTKN